jgi:hypothetical protein
MVARLRRTPARELTRITGGVGKGAAADISY